MFLFKELEDLSKHTTLKAGGFARYYSVITSEVELREQVRFAEENFLPLYVIGEGSNVLFSDKEYQGLVIRNQLKGIKVIAETDEEVLVEVASGEDLDQTIDWSLRAGYSGLQNLSAIPGTVGATPVQNVGAYGVEVSELIQSVRVLDIKSGEVKDMEQVECLFGYRDSLFKNNPGRYFILSVIFKLSKKFLYNIDYPDLKNYFNAKEPESPLEIREAVIQIRSQKFPDWRVVGTAGSFFKNPTVTEEFFRHLKVKYPNLPGYNIGEGKFKLALGYVLDKVAGLKGYREGQISLSDKQALVLINYGGATSEEIKSFSEKIIEKVFTLTNIEIEREVTLINF